MEKKFMDPKNRNRYKELKQQLNALSKDQLEERAKLLAKIIKFLEVMYPGRFTRLSPKDKIDCINQTDTLKHVQRWLQSKLSYYDRVNYTPDQTTLNYFSFLVDKLREAVESLTISNILLNKAKDVYKYGGKLYIVGGAVRDAVMNKPINDIDLVVTGITIDQAIELFGSKVAGNDAPVFLWYTEEFNEPLEVALARTEKKKEGGIKYNDFEFYTSPDITIEQDLARRDFTINAMAYDILERKLIDPFSGQQDIKRKLIRMVSESAFKEDTIRTLRAARFAARYNFKIEETTAHVIKEMAPDVARQTKERITKEIIKGLKDNNSDLFIKYLSELNLLPYIFTNSLASKRQKSLEYLRNLDNFAGDMDGTHKLLTTLTVYFLPYSDNLVSIRECLHALRFSNVIIDAVVFLVNAVSTLMSYSSTNDVEASKLIHIFRKVPRKQGIDQIIYAILPTLLHVFTKVDTNIINILKTVMQKKLSDYNIDPNTFADKSLIQTEFDKVRTKELAELTKIREMLNGYDKYISIVALVLLEDLENDIDSYDKALHLLADLVYNTYQRSDIHAYIGSRIKFLLKKAIELIPQDREYKNENDKKNRIYKDIENIIRYEKIGKKEHKHEY